MFKTKQDVDRHVIGIFKNMNSESERNLKCYRIAKHYYAVNDYKTAIKYINRYLSANPNSAAAHKLLGECYIHLNIKAKAFDALKTSLELDGSQRELVLTVCQLLVDPEVPLDLDRATYWLERAESFYPKDPAVFKLKQHILKGGSNSQKNSAQLEKLILAEVSANPTDVNVRIRLLQFFMESKRYEVAYEHAVELEDRKLFYNDLRWYNCLCNLIEEYEKSTENVIVPDLGFDFFLKKVTFLERRADLSMQEFLIDTKYTMDCSSAVFILDQTLATASKLKVPEAEKEFFHEFKRHMGAQLCYHMATLILKRAKKEYGIWQKAVSSASPLLFLACEKTTFVEDSWSNLWLSRNKNQMDSWNKSVALRLSQSGHVLNVWSRDRRNQFLQKVTQFCGGKWRDRVYMDVYYSRNHQQAMNTSYFLNNSTFADVPLNFLSEDDLVSFDELSQLAYPESLHHLVWLGLVSFKPNGQFKGDFRCKILPDLQFTVDNLFNTGAETLNQLDVDAFLYASVLCAKVFTPSNVNSDKPSLLPVCISEELCTPAQADWWASVYKIYRNKGTENISEIRMKLRKGIETVRVIGQHGLHVKLIVLLAKLFQERASKSKKPDEVTGLETRSYLYWTAAIPLLEKMIKNQELRLVPNRLFDYRSGELTPQEVKNYLEDGRLFLACRLIKLEEHEAAIEELSTLKSPYATFHQGLIYKKLALDVISGRPESITPENRSEYVILLTRARDAFFLTLERLRSPGVDHGHPLDSQIHTHLEEIECRLERIETDSTKNGDGELEDDESKTGIFPVYSDADNSYDMYNNGGTLSAMNDSLPSAARLSFGSRQINVKSESKPSMERLDAHLRYLVETNKNELREIKVAIQQGLMSEFKTLRNEMKGFKTVCNDILSELKKLNCNENTSVTKKQDTLDYSTSENPENTSHNVQQYKNYPSYINSPHIPTCQASNLQYGTRIVPQISNILPADRIPSSIMPNTFFPPQRSLTPADQLLLYQGLGYYAQGTTLPYTDHNTTQFRNIGTSKTSIIENNPTGVDINTVNNVPIMNEPQQQYQLTKDMHPMSVYGSSTIPSSPLVNATSSGAVNKSLPQQAHAFQIPLPAQAILVKTSPLQDRWSNQSEPISTSANIESNLTLATSSPIKDVGANKSYTPPASHKNDNSCIESDADSGFDFKPIIPLPEEVPTVTGEEDETKLFESRAKLLMFVNKNWVERGVGQIKVLHNENEGTARVVMRRENVLTVCANHLISSEMSIQPSKSDESALIWVANDYSDGESVHRQLCVRFKTLDEAKDFEYAFERGREIAKARNENKVSLKKQEPVKHDNSSLECPTCKSKYEHGKTICNKCTASVDAEKPKFGGFTWSSATGVKTVTSKSPAKVETSEDTSKPNPFANFTFKIGSSDPVPSEASEKSAFSDTQTIRTGITSFGSLAAAADVGNGFKKDENFKGFEGTGSLVFGYLNQNKGEQENKVDLNKTNDEDEGTGHASDFVPTAEFTPVIPLPDLVEVKTGEEEETVLYSERAKILRFVTETKEWKERGIGIMKVLLNEKTGKVRLLMRREQVLKVCCNHFLDEKMKFEPMTKNEKALTWYAQDFSEGDLKVELLALKFGKAESMQSFKKVIEDNQKNMKDGRIIGTKFVEDPKSVENNQKSLSELFKPAPGSWECEACCLRNKAEAIKCAACETRKPGTGTGESGSAKGEPSGITLDPSLMSKFSFGIPQTTVTVTNATTTTSTTTTPNNSFGFFGNFGSKATFDATPKFTFGITQPNNSETSSNDSPTPFGSKDADASNESLGFGRVNLPQELFVESNKICRGQENENVHSSGTKFGLEFPFGSPGAYNFSFSVNKPTNPSSGFAESLSTTTFTTGGKFGKIGSSTEKLIEKEQASSQIITTTSPSQMGTFATSPVKDSTDANTSTLNVSSKSDDSYVESEADPRPDFKPIIPLPEEVPTVTGEEDETKLFESRAKLLMFVNKNWVERGVGQIKVLHNENAGTARVVMRRDQVFKVCANHFILPEMEIVHSKTNDRALIYGANDYSDGESVHRQLCVRFKTLDEAKDFEYAFERGREIAKARIENKVSLKKQEPVKHDNSSLECPTCKNKYEHGKTICKTCTASVDAEKPKFGGFTWSSATGVKTVTSKSPEKVETSEDTSKPNPFANFTFKIGSSDAVPSEASEKSAFSDTQTIRTGITSFGSLAAAADVGNGFKKDENFKGFEGTGSLVFGYLNQNKGEQENKVDLNKTNDEDEGTGHASDFVPTAEFTPVIPLPDLVEVKTGEEEETVLYSERAKILRFVTETKEWKERGIGIMKVLLNEKTGKVRLLMRREQVLKVCCNHFLDEKMKFEPMTKNEKALTWYAQDFSEGDLKVELLALKFGKAESMQSFKKVIEDNQKNMKDGRIIGTKFVEDPKSVENNQKSLSELFKPAPGSWECEACCLRNKAEAIKCAACETRKPGTGTGESGSAKGEPSGITLDPSLMSKFSFGIPQTTVTVTNATTTTSTTTTPNNSFGFFGNFGSKATFDATPKFTFGIPQSNKSEKSIFGGSLNTFSGTTPLCKPTDSGGEDISIVFEAQASEEQRQKALDLKLPPNFFLYSNAPPCQGCRGCDDEDAEKGDVSNIISSKSETSFAAPIFETPGGWGKQTGSWGTFKFDIGTPKFGSDITFKFGNTTPQISETNIFGKKTERQESDGEADEDEEDDDDYDQDVEDDDEDEDEDEDEGEDEDEDEEVEEEEAKDEDEEYVDDEEAKDEDEDDVHEEEVEEDVEEYEQEGEEQDDEYSSFEPKLVVEKKNIRVVKTSPFGDSPSKSKTWGGRKKNKSPYFQIYQISPHEYEVHMRSANEEEIIDTKFVPRSESVVKETVRKCIWTLGDTQISIEFQSERDLSDFMELFERNEGEEDYHSARS